MKKQLQFTCSAIFMASFCLSVYGQNVGDQFKVDDIKYEITSIADAEVRIVVYEGAATKVDIPSEVSDGGKTYTVTAIGEDTDTFQNGVTVRPFINKGLTDVTIPDTVTIIGLGVFTNNNLTEVDIPDSVTHIRTWGFSGNRFIELTIPTSVEHIGPEAFHSSGSISVVRVDRNPPPEIDASAFSIHTLNGTPNPNLALVVPFSAIQVYEDAGWKDLGFVHITAGATTIDRITYGIVDARNEATLITHAGVGFNLIIPPTVDIDGYSQPVPVTAIGDDAFQGALILQRLIIPESVKRIGSRAFHNSPHIARVTVLSNDPPELAIDAFEYPRRGASIRVTVPKNRVNAYKAAGWTGFKDIFSLEGQIHIGGGGFDYKVLSVSPYKMGINAYVGDRPIDGHMEIPSEVKYWSLDGNLETLYPITSIEDGAFSRGGNFPLTSVNIPNSVTSIGESAFRQNDLTEVVIPDAVTHIGSSAFQDNQLTSVEIPDNVTDIGDSAFRNNQLTSVTTPANVNRINRWTYASNQLTEVTISSKVTWIGLYAFLDNPDLELVTVEATNPPSLHKDAFSNAYRDQIDLVVPPDTKQAYLDNGWEGFRSISYGIFTLDGITYGITSPEEVMVIEYTGTATAVTIPETVDDNDETYTVTTIKENAFQNKELSNIEIPNSVTSIGEGVFSDNQLVEVTLPSSVEHIAFHAFYNNPDLALVTVETNTPPALHRTAFANANRNQIDLVVPTDRLQAYKANGWDGFRSISEDGTPPQPTIGAPQSVDDLEPFTVSITFDGEITDFGVDDIQVTNATVSDLTGGGSAYTATIAATSPCDDITIGVPANVSTGVNGVPNPAAEQASVGVMDTTAPTITCPGDVVATAVDNGTGDCTATVGLGTPVTGDNCSVASVVAQVNGTGIDPGTYAFGGGTTTVTWIVTDGSGNTASCNQTVTVRATRDCGSELLADFNRGFSPNGDGIADTLVIEGLEAYRNNVVRIYDLSQHLLFSAHYGGPGDAWDGTQRGGNRVPVGSYVCVIDYNESGLGHETKIIYVNY